jgi:hypothetical protein
MSQFLIDLWESIFTPGPTPSLLVATNATFACLQVVLAGLLLATYSIHLLILSGLCAGLWYSINWFARELQVHQRREEEEKARRAKEARPVPKITVTDESDTEVEGSTAGAKEVPEPVHGSNDVEAVEHVGEVKHRAGGWEAGSQGTKSSVSTEDEWEKVSENENEKEKEKDQ